MVVKRYDPVLEEGVLSLAHVVQCTDFGMTSGNFSDTVKQVTPGSGAYTKMQGGAVSYLGETFYLAPPIFIRVTPN